MPDQSGLMLEQLCEEREVGIDGFIHWKDATLEEADIYHLMGWFESDNFYLDKHSAISDLKVISMLSPIKSDPFPNLFKILNADEDDFFPGNIYQSAGHFRYKELAEGV
jgi:hypothetical protein